MSKTRYERQHEEAAAKTAKEAAEKPVEITVTSKELAMLLEAVGVRMIAFAKNEDAQNCLAYADLYHKVEAELPF